MSRLLCVSLALVQGLLLAPGARAASAGSCHKAAGWPTGHSVLCDVDEAYCTGRGGGEWFAPGHVDSMTGCCHCRGDDSCVDTSPNCAYFDDSAGSCYDMSTHRVSCNVEESACLSVRYEPGYVSGRSGCCHCRGSCADTSSPDCNYYDSLGSCYDSTTHVVSCDVKQTACGGYWYPPGYTSDRDGCCHCRASCPDTTSRAVESCSYYDDETPTTTEVIQARPQWGCYSLATHSCDCESNAQDCSSGGGTWTECTACGGPTMTAATVEVGAAAPKQRPGVLVVILLVWVGLAAAGQDGAPRDAQAQAGPPAGRRELRGRRLGDGCYDHIDTHRCDCTVDEDHCTSVRGHTWTDQCRSCDAGIGVAHPDCPREYSWGCFDTDAHSCACAFSKNACDANSTLRWTHQCWSCCHHSVWGCYIPGQGCHCEIAEGACSRDFPEATWSYRCHECENIDPEPTDGTATEEEDAPKWVIPLICGVVGGIGCTALCAAAVFFRYFKRNAAAGRSAPPGGVVVGSPVGEPAASAADGGSSKA